MPPSEPLNHSATPKHSVSPGYNVRSIAFDDNRADHSFAVEWAIEQLEDAKAMMNKPGQDPELRNTIIHSDLMMAEQVIAHVRKHYALQQGTST
jgi:hypothetical protein